MPDSTETARPVDTSNFNTKNAKPKIPGHAEKGASGKPGEGDGAEPGSQG